ncbi:MAG: phosphatase PAP2 family protein [Cyanobacteriota bacterium]|nr:phosphatase PAP2 family protein [Cyanobacteriota bacterium]
MTPSFTRRDGLTIAICLAVLLGLARLVTAQDQAPELDEALLDGLGRLLAGPIGALLLQVYRLSGVGFTAVLVMVALVFLVLKRWWNDLKLLVMATGGILMIVDLWLKPLFDRARPHAKLLPVDGRSFPSGHAAGSIAFYFAMVAILSLHYPHLRRPLMIGATLWVVLVWLSTLVARAHWPSDLLAGGVVGLAWLTICLAFWRPGVRP